MIRACQPGPVARKRSMSVAASNGIANQTGSEVAITARLRLPTPLCNSISSRMAPAHAPHVSHAVSENPGWSLLRLSAAGRIGLAGVVVALVWAVTLAVIL